MRIAAHLFPHVEAHYLGMVYAAGTGFQLTQDPDTVRAPAVAIEAISPSNPHPESKIIAVPSSAAVG
jgi:hypothetical protein